MLSRKIFLALLIVLSIFSMSRAASNASGLTNNKDIMQEKSMNQNANNESPIACNMNALDKEQRQHHKLLTSQLQNAILETQELKDGYSFRLPSDKVMIQKAAEWVTLERRCCPFITFWLEVGREGGPLFLSLTGREGVKPFLKMELGIK